MRTNFKVNDSIYIGEERKDNKVIYYVTDDGKETILHTFDIDDNRQHGCNYSRDFVFAWSSDKYGRHLSINAIYDINKKRNISLNPDDASKYMNVFIYTKSFSLRDVLTLINNWDYEYGKSDSFRSMIDYLTGGDKEISRECIIDYVCRCYPSLREHCSYKEPISTLTYLYIALDFDCDFLSFHMMPQVITDNSSDNLIDSMDRYITELKQLNEKNPEEAKRVAKEGLMRMGIINENGDRTNTDDFTRGPKRVRSKND